MKFIHAVLIVIIIIVLDQWLKIHIKTTFFMDEDRSMIGNWARLHFIENEGMAFGLKFWGEKGKILLTSFRILASVFGFFFIYKLIKEKYNNGLIICASLVLAGAIGNTIDCVFYGKIFTESGYHFGAAPAKLVPYGQGYGKLFQGRVVDMLYFPIIKTKSFEFFSLIFNIADAAISTGVIAILVFQKWIFNKKQSAQPAQDAEQSPLQHLESIEEANNVQA